MSERKDISDTLQPLEAMWMMDVFGSKAMSLLGEIFDPTVMLSVMYVKSVKAAI